MIDEPSVQRFFFASFLIQLITADRRSQQVFHVWKYFSQEMWSFCISFFLHPAGQNSLQKFNFEIMHSVSLCVCVCSKMYKFTVNICKKKLEY